ncbi:MAG: serine hydrolase [Gemmatimonas sp.]|nr:serine hydrolase [Gemmatimonas sp.]
MTVDTSYRVLPARLAGEHSPAQLRRMQPWLDRTRPPSYPCRWILTLGCLFVIELTGGAPAASQASAKPTVAEIVDSIAAAAVGSGQIAGLSVAIARGTEAMVFRGYGWSDVEHRIPTPPDAVYEIGSITKQFTAAAILLLQEQGRLSIDDLVTDHLPQFPTRGRAVSLRHLLSHTSGIPDFTALPDFSALATRGAPLDSIVALVEDQPLLFVPGQAMAYSNSGYILLGRIIESASGVRYADFIEAQLFVPAGMLDSSYCDAAGLPASRTVGHRLLNRILLPTESLDHTWPYAAGSLCSTAADLIAWNRALHGGRLLSPESYEILTDPGELEDGTRLRYAAGLIVDSIGNRPVYRHGGSIPGFRAELLYFPEDGLSIAILLNTDGSISPLGLGEDLSARIHGATDGGRQVDYPLRRPAVDYVGEYRGVGRDGTRSVYVGATSPDRLVLRREDDQVRPLRPVGPDVFRAGRTWMTFNREADEIVSVRFDEIGENSILTRVR